ncbi:hypothetical protein LPW11_04055 [Geomonas sp. RF6]|uniref:hypothetical protein n=1 Tax=Geomonas sp. RF6 TaxID=2897342 RepID=UPI001E61EE01|nr:hypothetical protein [Geomonas sp. RF6]UFS71372.1 hypothetical protein LPW11_04055 [Geomonas sp. RF6]
MIKRIVFFLSLVILVLNLAGCLGVGYDQFNRREETETNVESLKKQYGIETEGAVTKEVFLQGRTPDKVEPSGEYERLIFYDEGDWRGGVFWLDVVVVPIPIPFMMYFGKERAEWVFRNGELIQRRYIGSHMSTSCFCGFFYEFERTGDIQPACGCE